MKLIFALTFILITNIAYAQKSSPTIKQVYKLLKLSIDQSSKKSISIGSGEWLICNQDSAFFKDDTLRLYDHINYFYQLSKCCDFVGWTFYKKNAFVQSRSQICKEPASGSAYTEYYNIQLFSKDKRTFMNVKKQAIVTEKFEIIRIKNVALANNNFSNVITLKRLR
ncbi:hypothetical protein NAF17_10065 [Mucilaginibacter sp. RB4R14]|uniref:hypothetical protein n=1 Tax=Mucilaginibacter aurantiaciroseus TaxID=2949308 RepID=UPI002091606A|nr:hypothetical protein [Mucilaginibacter aurantiaciroseus]MCO5935889.1 hypothetical protein [Mucilaginibacter aurantiaciroseus]